MDFFFTSSKTLKKDFSVDFFSFKFLKEDFSVEESTGFMVTIHVINTCVSTTK